MVEYTYDLNSLLEALSDNTRRDIIQRVKDQDLTISEIALEYSMSIAAVSKHIQVLEDSGIILKRKDGRKRYVQLKKDSILVIESYISNLIT